MSSVNEHLQQTGGQADDVFVIPASFAQQRLWFVDQLDGAGNTYNIFYTYRLQGLLDVTILQKSLQAIVDRHESLRTTFGSRDGAAMQVVRASWDVALEVTDLSECPETERQERWQRHIEHANRPFDLGSGPLFSFHLLQLGDREHELLVNMHHIISDGWSMDVFARELAAFYEAFVTGCEVQLPELPIQYADYSVWQRDWMQGAVLEEQLGYWKQKLSGELPVLQVPQDHPRPPKQTFNGRTRSLTLSAPLSNALKELCRTEGTTLNMALLAAYKTLLYRYTGLEDIVVGAPVAGRNQEETADLIGFFVNTQVLRTELSGEPTFRELLGRVRQTVVEAIEHQDVPFEKLVEELQPQRDLSRSPLVQVMFAFENFQTAASAVTEFAGMRMTARPVETGVSKFDLTLYMGDAGDSLYARVEYNTDLYDETTIERFIGHLTTLLEAVAVDPTVRISHVPILGEAERQQLLVEWNDTTTDYWQGKSSLQELFESEVERAPEAVALVFEGRTMTYRELNERANRLAHHLKKRGVGPEIKVGLCMERSLEMVIGLLGIVKAGGAYVPLDPAYPQERLTFLMQDSNVSLMLTLRHLLDRLPPLPAQTLCLDTEWEQVAGECAENPSVLTNPDSLLTVIYTSGSTGTPKGVCVLHRGVARLVKETDYMEYSPEEVFLQYGPISFDAATYEIWGSLLNGAKLVIYPPYKAALEELGQVIRTEGITAMFMTAGLFHQMVELNPDDLLRVPQLITGGDVVSVLHAKKMFAKDPTWRFIQVYGPTECSTYTTASWMTSDMPLENSLPIGRAISNTTLYVLDRRMQPVPIGVPGEMYIGGPGVARGYLNRPELTAARFVHNPFAAEPGATMYRTGDLVRYLADGNLEFIGRIDNQVKIRGFRVELGEIEVALGKHPAVGDAVVIAREDVPGDKRIVAYVVPESGAAEVNALDLRNYLKANLPEYMVPAAVVLLDVFPLNPNGKVDRKALPKPGYEAVSAFVAPRNQEEQQIAAIWAEVLSVEQVGVHDNFFDRGGHSLLATQTISRLRKALQVEIPLRALFESPTVAELTMWVAERKQAAKKVQPAMKATSREAFRKSKSSLNQE